MAVQVIQIYTEEELEQKIASSLRANNQRLIDELLAQLGLRQAEPRYYSRKETARKLGVTLPTLHAWTMEGRITAHRISGRVLYKQADIDNALQKIQTTIRATA